MVQTRKRPTLAEAIKAKKVALRVNRNGTPNGVDFRAWSLFTSPIGAARSPLNLHLAEEHTPGGWPLLGFTAETLAFFNRPGQQTFTPAILELLSYWLRRDVMQLFEASDLALALVLLLCMSGVCAIAQCGYHTLLRCSRLRCSSSGTLLV